MAVGIKLQPHCLKRIEIYSGAKMLRSAVSSGMAELTKSEQKLLDGLVSVSVIMPIRNEANFIGGSLLAVLTQQYPHELLEVLIADGQSDDGTRQAIADVAKAHPDVTRYPTRQP